VITGQGKLPVAHCAPGDMIRGCALAPRYSPPANGSLSWDLPYKRRLSALVSKGYFPKELPPAFTTHDFGHHVSEILGDWEAKGVFRRKSPGNVPNTNKKKSNSYLYGVDDADSEIISMPKRGYERRNLHITHPIPHALLCYELTINWRTIQKWLSRQMFSLDEIRILDTYERSIKGINHQAHEAKKAYIASSSDWLIKTDISRFYPTIYTHSIAWAAYGKEKVKKMFDFITALSQIV
jgi:hypothetical protein